MNPDDVCDINSGTTIKKCCVGPLSDACRDAMGAGECPAGDDYTNDTVCQFSDSLSPQEIQSIREEKRLLNEAMRKRKTRHHNKKVLVIC